MIPSIENIDSVRRYINERCRWTLQQGELVERASPVR